MMMLVLVACKVQHPISNANKTVKHYLFIGHCYSYQDPNNKLDPRIEQLNLQQYDQCWWGGDLLFYGIKGKRSLNYLNKTIDLKNSNTHWALGNHDTLGNNVHLLEKYTLQKSYYVQQEDGLTLMVLNNNIANDNCKERNAQYRLFQQVCDTLQSKYFVLLTHQLIWGKTEPNMPTAKYDNGAGYRWKASCSDPFHFEAAMYPYLIELQQKGTQVYVISGDAGQLNKEGLAYTTADGVTFLATGINHTAEVAFGRTGKSPDRALLFEHDLTTQQLHWRFDMLDSLPKK